MGRVVYQNSPITTITYGNNAFGTAVDLLTSDFYFTSFLLCGNSASNGGTGILQIYLNGVAYGPAWILDSSMSEEYHIPLPIPKGVTVSVAGYWGGGSPAGYITFVGVYDPSEFVASQAVSLSTDVAYITGISDTSAWTQLGGALASLPVRKITSVSSNFSSAFIGNYDLGFGPSATSVTPIITGIPFGTQNLAYNNRKFECKTDFMGTGNYLFARSTVANLGLYPYYFN